MEEEKEKLIEEEDAEADEVEATREYECDKKKGKVELVRLEELFDSVEVDLKSDLSDWKKGEG